MPLLILNLNIDNQMEYHFLIFGYIIKINIYILCGVLLRIFHYLLVQNQGDGHFIVACLSCVHLLDSFTQYARCI